MAFSSTDLTSIEAAITALATGERVARVMMGGKSIEYHPADLDKLIKLRAIVSADVAATAGSGGMLRRVAFKDPA